MLTASFAQPHLCELAAPAPLRVQRELASQHRIRRLAWRSSASSRLWQRRQMAARFSRLAASGRRSYTWTTVRTTSEPVTKSAEVAAGGHL